MSLGGEIPDLSQELADKLSDSLIRRNVEIEGRVKVRAAEIVAIVVGLYLGAESEEVRLGVVKLANEIANLTHALGMIPRDVVQEAINVALEEHSMRSVVPNIAEECTRRVDEKLEKMAQGEAVGDHSEDGLFVGFKIEVGGDEAPDFY